jgi:hypothetical protein
MALAFGFSASGAGTVSGSTVTGISILNNANAVGVLYVTHYANGAFTTTTSITDASGVTWNLRKRVKIQSAWLGAGSTANASYIVQETWWANDATSTNRALTLNVANAGSIVKTEWVYQSITGSLSVAAPWDTHSSLTTAAQTFGNPGTTTAAITLGVTTAQNNSQVLAMLSEIMSTSASTASSTGTGMTAVNNQTDGVSPNQFHMFLQNKLQATAGAVTASATNNKQSFIFTADALTGTSTGSSASAGTIELASVQNLSSGNGNMGTGASGTFTFTNTAPCVIVANIVTQGGTGFNFVPITGVTDSAGHTWNKRSAVSYTSANFNGLGGVKFITEEVWWANVTAAHGSNVTVTVAVSNNSNEASNKLVSWATFTGSMSPSAPWDTGANLGTVASYSHASVATLPTEGWTVSTAGSILLGFLMQYGASGNTNVSAAPSGYTLGSAHITIGTSGTGPAQNALAWATSAQAAAGSGTQTWQTNSTLEWTLFADALTGTSVGSSQQAGGQTGTATTALTKVSQSAVAVEKFTGTISTALTKASMAAAAKEIFTGAVSTALTKASMAASGSQSFVANTMTTRLTGISQVASDVEEFIGTITTALSGISQIASSPVSITGTVSMALTPTSQIVTAQEIFLGAAQTDLGATGIMMEADTFEVFAGTIVTRLNPASFGLVAEEDFVAHVRTDLGLASGQIIATEVDALLVIGGPIETDLSKAGQTILGAMLGTPGGGKWYSYRYLDS